MKAKRRYFYLDDFEHRLLVGDYYLIAGDDEPEESSIGIWGCGCPVDTSAKGRSTNRAGRRDQRHLRYLKQQQKSLITI